MRPSSRRLLCAWAGGLTAGLGLMVMAGWFARSETLVRTPGGFAPMYFNVALCFFLLGLGLLASVRQKRGISVAAAALSGIVAILTLLQSILAVDLKIDRLFVEPFLTVPGAQFPGRMQRDGAFTFLLSSLGLLLFNLRSRRSLLGILLSSWALIIGAVALLVYALAYMVYDSPSSQLSVHYAAAFLVLGAGLVLRGIQPEGEPEREDRGLRARILVGYATALILLLFIAIASQLAIARSNETERLVTRALRARAQIEELYSHVKDVQRGQRGFVITGDESYLGPYFAGKGSLPAKLGALRGLLNDAAQLQRLSDLEPLIQRQLQVQARFVVVRREKGMRAAVEQVRAGEGERGMTEIHERVFELQRFQDELLRKRAEVSRRTATLTSRINAAGILLAIAIAVIGLVTVFRGLRARERAEDDIQELNRALSERGRSLAAVNDQLTEVNGELEAFSYSVSHDLRAPLRHMTGFAQILREDFAASLPQEAQGYLAKIQRSAGQMGTLIDGLLNLSRLGRAELVRAEVDLNRLVQEGREMVSADSGNRRVEWRVEPLPVVIGDPGLLRQVLVNLLANALKYSRNRAPARIEVGQTETGGTRAIFVRDNGIGFDMNFAGKLFGVFERLHASSEFEGTGIGLATVRRIIVRHGGRIWAESAPGQGATFYFTLPHQAADVRAGGALQEAAHD